MSDTNQQKRFWHFLTCQNYAETASRSLDEPLSFWERFWYKLHHLHCAFCRRLHKQLMLIDEASSRMDEETCAFEEHKIPEEAKDKIKNCLKEQQ